MIQSVLPAPVTTMGGRSLAERAYLLIRDQLITLEIRPGDPINDDALAVTLAMGRTPVREALKRLEGERLVIAHSRRGTFATDVNITDLRHIFEVREQLEPVAAAAAARRVTDVDRHRLRELQRSLLTPRTRTADVGALMRLDLQVHRGIYAATHNPYLEATLIGYDNLATRIWCLFADRLQDLAGHVDEHVALVQAVVEGRAEDAAMLATEHVAHFERAIRAVI
jgi:DNA-binding GntR family transcriptional regulator